MHTKTTSRFIVPGGWLMLLMALAPFAETDAAINACRTDSGVVTFQDQPCEQTGSRARRPQNRHTQRPPLGLHESWFELIEPAPHVVSCHQGGCDCGINSRVFESGLADAVADALYLDGAWHRYESELAAAIDTSRVSEQSLQTRTSLAEAACEVMMSQETLRIHGETAVRELRTRAREAEERGYDEPTACNEGDAIACGYLDARELFLRVRTDLGALRASRHRVMDTIGNLAPGSDTVQRRPLQRLP